MDGEIRLARQAHDLIDRGWAQHADARAADGNAVHPCDDTATSWSLLGALVAALESVAGLDGERPAFDELASTCVRLADIVDSDSLEDWNDDTARTHDEVLAALAGVAT